MVYVYLLINQNTNKKGSCCVSYFVYHRVDTVASSITNEITAFVIEY